MAAPRASPSGTGNAGPPPDLSARFKLKAKYADLQKKYTRSLEVRKDLTLEANEKDAKVQRLQDEVNLVLDQIYATDYKHLLPADDDLFSEDALSESDADGSGEDDDSESDEDDEDDPGPKTENGAGSGNGVDPRMINGNGNGHAAENGRVRKERPEESPTNGEEPHSDERAPKRARVDDEVALAAPAPTAVPAPLP
ncbi:hypothetical protein RQP46_006013 [Phenoliferia psychrophenolica]